MSDAIIISLAGTRPVEWRKDMDWETPSFVEVKMDAEINSYQDDFADTPDMTEPSLEDRIVTALHSHR